MNAEDRELLKTVQDFLMTCVLQDITAAAHHRVAEKLYAVVHLRRTRERPFLEHFLKWRNGPENSVRENPKAELMVYQGLFPGRITDLLLELLT